MSNTTNNQSAARDAGRSIQERMKADGYEYNGITWLSPYTGELLSFEQAREEYSDHLDDLASEAADEHETRSIYGDAQ